MKRIVLSLSMLFGLAPAVHADPYIGDLIVTGHTFCATGYLEANGQLLSISDYNALFSLLGTKFGGDGQNTFGLPNLNPAYTASPGRATLKQCIATDGIYPPQP